MFKNGRYAQAKVAFRRAGQVREVKICDAFFLREKARLISTTADEARTQAFLDAANAFFARAQDAPSERVNERQICFSAAVECYLEARDLRKAGDIHRMVKQYRAAALCYKEGECIDEMVEVITQYESAFDSDHHKTLMKFARMHYFKVSFDSWVISKSL